METNSYQTISDNKYLPLLRVWTKHPNYHLSVKNSISILEQTRRFTNPTWLSSCFTASKTEGIYMGEKSTNCNIPKSCLKDNYKKHFWMRDLGSKELRFIAMPWIKPHIYKSSWICIKLKSVSKCYIVATRFMNCVSCSEFLRLIAVKN